MGSLKEILDQKLKQSMKDRQEAAVSIYRMLLSAIKYREIEIGKALDDSGVVGVVQKMLKQASESIEQFKKGNREDLVKKTEEEVIFLKPFLPEQISLEEVRNKVKAVVDRLQATSPKQMGEVMKSVTDVLAGRADMKDVSRIVKEFLSGHKG